MNKKWFTLIELTVAITILSIVMLSVFVIYWNIVNANKRLELIRVLQENSRNITENIAKDIREKWIDYNYYSSFQALNYSSWNTLLAIKNWDVYCLIENTGYCDVDNSCDTDNSCYLWKLNWKKISDGRVWVKNIKFYISWKPNDTNITNKDAEWKATVAFELGIAPGRWISSSLAKEIKMNIQTTISEKIYKK
ncbi:MAG: hypothetical protein ACD_4C00337G0008 [uncultured bacterium (gcode 4)]|uniref:Uncharacterized protein n=1 Tax=uncultured bacterium (gcode 4) TaxID=1234023 RepID=K2GSM0_9BACT|nr:MAG: hypothetical protein ACD_4C00337G0008 [uncultured bacterium (gcode 4)]